MKKLLLAILLGTVTLGTNAGDWGKAPVGKAPIEECYDIGGEISAGYMTDFYRWGFHLGQDSVWTDVNYTFDNLAVPVTIGVWYLNVIHEAPATFTGDFLETYISAALGSFAGFDVSVSYSHFFFPEFGGDDFGEIALLARRNLGFVDFIFETNYLTIDSNSGWYHRAGLEKAIPITDAVSLVLAGGVGFLDLADDPLDAGWNHYYLNVSLPIQLNCRTVLTPYVGYYGSLFDDLLQLTAPFPFEDNVHAGVTLTVTF